MMHKNMKIAIPTEDGLIVEQQCRCSRGFMVATVKSGKIVHEELRWNLLSEILTSEEGLFYNLCDCDIVIVNQLSERHSENLKAKKKKIVQTDETDISKAFSNFLDQNQDLPAVEKEKKKSMPVV
jgi:predicted Fe-Mo cluster-binding NifX family protein